MDVPAIECRQLSRRYGEVEALQPLDLQVAAGVIFGFLGRNGAGKTTTIRLLAGLAHPTTGSAWINGVQTTATGSLARAQFGYLPQDPAFYKWMTPREYLDYVGQLFQMEREERRRRVEEMLGLSGLSAAADRHIGGFSGGMVQRLGVAQALLHRPPVLLLDEPTSALDPAGRYELLELISGLRGQVTVFFSSHILADIERICDRVGIIHEGRLLLESGRDELLARYATNVMLLEVERESVLLLPAFLADLQSRPWVAGATVTENVVRVMVAGEVNAGKRALIPLIAAHNLLLNRYEWVRPSLEEIFLSLSQSGRSSPTGEK